MIHIKMADELMAKIKAKAEEMHMTVSGFIRHCVFEFLKK